MGNEFVLDCDLQLPVLTFYLFGDFSRPTVVITAVGGRRGRFGRAESPILLCLMVRPGLLITGHQRVLSSYRYLTGEILPDLSRKRQLPGSHVHRTALNKPVMCPSGHL